MNKQYSTLDTLDSPDNFIKLFNNKYLKKDSSYITINSDLKFYKTDTLDKSTILPFYKIDKDISSKDIKDTVLVTDTKFNLKLDFETGQFLGILIGDGWWDHKDYYTNRCIYLADKKGFNAAYIKKYLSETLGIKDLKYRFKEELKENDSSRYGDSVRHIFSFDGSTAFAKWLTFNFGGERTRYSSGAATKNINSFFIKNTSLEFKKGILSGLFSTDGSIAINNYMSKPRLNIAFSSTSKQLIEDIQALSDSIGLNYLSNFNKTTIKGNNAYNFNPSVIDAKLLNLFDRIADLDKRFNFLNTNVNLDNTKNDNVYIPISINTYFRSILHKPLLENEISYKEVTTLISTLLKSKNTFLVSRSMALKLLAAEVSLNKDRKEALDTAKLFFKTAEGMYFNDSINKVFDIAFKACYPDYIASISEIRKRLKNRFRIFFLRNKGKLITKAHINYISNFLESNEAYLTDSEKNNPLIKKWKEVIINNNNIIWSKIDAE